MARFCRQWSSCLPLALVLAGCGDDGSGDAASGDTTVSPASTGTTPADPTSGQASEPTSVGPGTDATSGPTSEVTSEATSEATGPNPTTTGDTSPDAPACPLADPRGVSVLTLTPELFADGADPSGSESCKLANPERGFHQFTDLRDLDADTLDDAAAAGLTVLYGQVLLPEFIDAPLDAGVLADIAAGFDLVRAHGLKVVPRFHYSNDGDEPDAELGRILGHIDQLTPLLQEHADVIVTLQAGFIGAWGEWHSSQNGLDAPGPRKQILDALLAALPADRTVGVRRPSFKDDAYGGPLTIATAHDGSPLARVGHINDCFLASDDDEGTYQVDGEKDYAIADSAFVPVGGETCKVNPPRSECPAALAELELLHWTHLNLGYHPDVLDSWRDAGCFDEVACRLGYRLAVLELRWTATATPGGAVPVALKLHNDGYAAPINPRPLIVVFDGPSRVEVVADGVDPRTWQPGATELCVDAVLPADMPAGDYRIGLRLPDAAPTLADDPRQAIRLVNGTWDPVDATHWFEASVTVE